jgi:streptogramin lyase
VTRRTVIGCACVVALALLVPTVAAGAERFERFYLPGSGPDSGTVAQGPDGNVWTGRGHALVSVDSDGHVHRRPTPGLTPAFLAAGAGGSLWFVDSDRNRVARLDAHGDLTTIPQSAELEPDGPLTLGPDGAMWLVELEAGAIARIAPDGTVSRIPLPGLRPWSITAGPDGNVWFTADAHKAGTSLFVGRLTAAGALATFPLKGDLVDFQQITAGADGNLWVATDGPLARVTPQGEISYVHAGGLGSQAVAAGPDGNIWYSTLSWVGWVSPTGAKRQHYGAAFGTAIGYGCGAVTLPGESLAFTADGVLWAASFEDRAIDRLATGPRRPPPVRRLIARHGAMRDANSMVRGRAGSVWIGTRGAIMHVLESGRRRVYHPALHDWAPALARAPHGGVWFVYADGIGRLSASGRVHRYPIGSGIGTLAPGSAGMVWFTDQPRRAIGVLTASGHVSRIPLSRTAAPGTIALGRHGRHWVTDDHHAIWRVGRRGAVRRFSLRDGADPTALALGRDGNLWFTEFEGRRIGRITPAGRIREFRVKGSPAAITRGPDGAMWFNTAEAHGGDWGGGLGRITYAGRVDEFPVRPTCDVDVLGLVAGPHRRLWFSEIHGPTAVGEMDLRRLSEAGALP